MNWTPCGSWTRRVPEEAWVHCPTVSPLGASFAPVGPRTWLATGCRIGERAGRQRPNHSGRPGAGAGVRRERAHAVPWGSPRRERRAEHCQAVTFSPVSDASRHAVWTGPGAPRKMEGPKLSTWGCAGASPGAGRIPHFRPLYGWNSPGWARSRPDSSCALSLTFRASIRLEQVMGAGCRIGYRATRTTGSCDVPQSFRTWFWASLHCRRTSAPGSRCIRDVTYRLAARPRRSRAGRHRTTALAAAASMTAWAP